MDANSLYFYRKTMPLSLEEQKKRGCKYYNGSAGVAGFTRPQSKMNLYLYGTMEDLEEFLKNRKMSLRNGDDLKLFGGGVD